VEGAGKVDVSHFTMVGFALDTHDEAAFSRTAQKLAAECRPANLTPSDLVCLIRDNTGAELRFGLQRDDKGNTAIATMNPAFTGEGRVPLEIAADVSDPSAKPFEVSVSAHFSGEKTPVVFDLADPLQAAKVVVGKPINVDIAAFSFKPEVYADESAFLQAQAKSDSRATFAANFFIPSGMFFEHLGGAMPDDAKRPVAYADFAGTILKCQRKINVQGGGGGFWWALVQTYDNATIDVVLDPRTVDGDLKPGEIITGRFWLTGHLVNQ
jgi:hypothetical protein